MTTNRHPRLIDLSYGVYRAGLRAYPRRFQRSIAMRSLNSFEDCCRESYRSQGLPGLVHIWVRAAVDLGRNVPQEYVAELTMKQPEHPRTLTRCTYCSEEIIVDDARCMYCGARLSDPLATSTVVRPVDRPGNFFDDTSAAVLAAPVRFEYEQHEHHG